MPLHDWRECEQPNCEICYPELAEAFKKSWEEEEAERRARHICTIITVDFKAKKVISRRETSS